MVITTVLVVLVGAWVTTRSNRQHANSMREQAKAEKIADSRQAWINELRDNLAQFIGNLHRLWDLHQMEIGREAAVHRAADPSIAIQETLQRASLRNQLLADAERLRAKILLMLNPRESSYIGFEQLLQQALENAKENNINVISNCNLIVQNTQQLLKSEWERVKRFE